MFELEFAIVILGDHFLVVRKVPFDQGGTQHIIPTRHDDLVVRETGSPTVPSTLGRIRCNTLTVLAGTIICRSSPLRLLG